MMDQTPEAKEPTIKRNFSPEKYPWLRRLEFTVALTAVLAVGAILVWKAL